MGDILNVGAYIFYILLTIYVAFKFVRAIRIVPAQEEYIVERLGKYHKTLGAGFHALIPFLDLVRYVVTLKEEAIDVPAQVCITRDNVQVKVDGIIYMKVMESYKAAYNITDYRYAVIQLAQTTMRAAFGELDLDKTFEERSQLNAKIVAVVDQAAADWGVDIKRYEIQNITPSKEVLHSMEKQMTAEREKRAKIAISEGQMTSVINRSEGLKQELINRSEGQKMKMINEAEGKASEIRAVANATAAGIRKIAESLNAAGGVEAMQLSLSEEYLRKLGGLARKENQVILPMDLSNMDDVLDGIQRIGPKKN
ncbi:MAG: paraslipin [Leptospirales bacterium]|nr:paraslipin [Leptospirales bacterium]